MIGNCPSIIIPVSQSVVTQSLANLRRAHTELLTQPASIPHSTTSRKAAASDAVVVV